MKTKLFVLMSVVPVLLCFASCQHNHGNMHELENPVESIETGSVNAVYEDGTFTVVEATENNGGLLRKECELVSADYFVDEVAVSSNQYPIYINEYGYDMAGPIFEVTEEVHDSMVGRLQDYLYLLYGEHVPSDKITVPEYVTAKDLVEYSRENTSFLARPYFISVSFPYDELPGEVPQDITIDSLQCVDQIKAAMEYLGIRNPQMQATVSYDLKNNPIEYLYKIFEESDNSDEYIVNSSFNYIDLIYTVGSENALLQIYKNEIPQIYSNPSLVSISSASEYIEQKYSDVTVSKDKVEVYYSTTIVPGHYIPCYKFYVDKYSEDKSEKLGYVVDISMVSKEDLTKMKDSVSKAK